MDAETKSEVSRLDAENVRQNKRIDKLESQMDSVQEIAMSVQKLAINMENMLKEQVKQGERLAKLEAQPAEAWSNTRKTIFNSLLGALTSAFGIGLMWAIINNMK